MARGGLWGPSVALGVIAPLCASLSLVLAGPEGCSRGRWCSGPSKWRHTATLGGRGQGAPRTCRCIETCKGVRVKWGFFVVREHHAPVGALRQHSPSKERKLKFRQGAPRTCRCIETRCPCRLWPRRASLGSTQGVGALTRSTEPDAERVSRTHRNRRHRPAAGRVGRASVMPTAGASRPPVQGRR